jgi:hypothetical protein
VKISKKTLGASIVIGVCSLALPGRADIFNPNFTVVEVHSVGGANKAGSFAASAMMGARGHSNQALITNWESALTTSCANQSGTTPWPGHCNPNGMAAALRTLTAKNWIQATFADTDQVTALNNMVGSLQSFHSPAVVPIFGQADHWVAVVQITATLSGSTWAISNVKFRDGGPVGQVDGGTNSYEPGLLSFSGNVWKTVYFRVLENINPACDPCTTDPWYNKFVLTWEPPPGEHPDVSANFLRSPGVAQGGMSEPLARSLVWNSLIAAGINADPEVWNPITSGFAGTAFEVNGLQPSGDRWDYFLVPILSASSSSTVIGYVQLAADDGAFETVSVLPTPAAFQPVSRGQAEVLARGALNPGETLTTPILTWDPRSKTPFAKSPTNPYYEFGVLNRVKEIGVVRVSLDKGIVIRSP